VQKYVRQAEDDRQVYVKALAAYEAEKASSVSLLCFVLNRWLMNYMS